MSKYSPIIGLEIHVQLDTKTKLFCSCNNESFGAEPNTNICPLCSGQPGTLPVMNKQAVNFAIKAGLAMNCEINKHTKWDRKSYFYPDLPKGYQISQYDQPIDMGGYIEIFLENEKKELVSKKIRLERAHLEEDAGKSIHDKSIEYTFLDYNRCGTPLLEIVSKPDMFSAVEAELYAREIRRRMRYVEVSRCDMEKGHMRFDINVNLKVEKDDGEIAFTPIAEVKNLNSFKSLVKAIEYEIERQKNEFEETGIVKNDGNKTTRLWNDNRGATAQMRTKEEAADYRYFPDPDIMPVIISDEWIKEIQETLPEMPSVRFNRYLNLGLSKTVSYYVVDNISLANYLDDCLKLIGDKQELQKEFLNWFGRDLFSQMNQTTNSDDTNISIKITKEDFVGLIELIINKKITRNLAKEFLVDMWDNGKTLNELKASIPNESINIDEVINKVISSNQNMLEQWKNGNEKVFNVFVGLTMKETKGLVDPQEIQAKLKEILKK
ncbi:MAG: Asp-tRNA(Asn)/Glu-tRNA(Gln) amidotransferase subunit GatB [Patescibacteria group bacterium]